MTDLAGYKWGGSSITEKDWEFISKSIEENEVKRVLEFGCGLSTVLISKIATVIAYEEQDKYADSARKSLTHPSEVAIYKDDIETNDFDLIFLDSSSNNREKTFEIASKSSAKFIIVHDAGRKEEKELQEKYLTNLFYKVSDGGTRCRMWKRKTNKESVPCNVRMISTARGWGGCARSITTIMKILSCNGYNVEFVPFHYKNAMEDGIGREFRKCLRDELPEVVVRGYEAITDRCDITVVYSDDYVWEFKREDLSEKFSNLNCDRKIMIINYRLGSVGDIEWTKGWTKYLFLNSTHECDLKKREPNADTMVLAPCTDLSKFFESTPTFDSLRLIRHSSQGDFKFDKNNVQKEIEEILACRDDLQILMMPGPSVVESNNRFKKFNKNKPPVDQFLSKGNLFYYSLPKGFVDAGPRVILEAMAAGLPVIADNWGGAKDRVIPGTGWLCDNKDDYVSIIKKITMDELKAMGQNARQHAMKNFVPERWVEEILGKSLASI